MNEWVKQTNIKGPQGDQGLQGVQGIRGGTWWYGDDYPTPDPSRYVDGDMYMKAVDPNGGTVWRWNGNSLQWIYTGADITGPIGPQGPQGEASTVPGPQGPPGPEGPQGPSGGGASVGTTPPAGPVLGQLWWKTDEKTLYVWDGSIWDPALGTWA